MSIRNALLTLLSEGPKYGLQLQTEFETRTGAVWPLNIGQVYTTLQRLERDGLIESEGDENNGPQKGFRLTAAGAREITEWLQTPPDMVPPPRNELVIKVLVARQMVGVDVHQVLQIHRRHLVELMQRYTHLKATANEDDIALVLVIDSELFRLDGIVRWLDATEVRLAQFQNVNHPDRRGEVSSMTQILELFQVSKVYGEGATEVRALRQVNLAVDRGELVAIMGPSGSGKSTLLTIAGSLEEPTSGEVRVGGVALSSLSRNDQARLRCRTIGYVFQDFNLLAGLTAIENVALPLELDGNGVPTAHAAGLAAMKELGIADRANHYPDELSGGERQRVAIARAIVGKRQLILADEPTGALDSVNSEAVMRLLRAACKRGMAGIVVTHDPQLAAWADRVIFLRDGTMVDQTFPVPNAASGIATGRSV